MFFGKDKEAIVKCNCGLLEHQIHLNDDHGLVEIALIPTSRTFKEKLHLIWKILRGQELCIYDIVIDKTDCMHLGDWLKQRGS